MTNYWFLNKEKLLLHTCALRTHENKRKLKQKTHFLLYWSHLLHFIPTLCGTKFLEYVLKIIDQETSSSFFIDKFEFSAWHIFKIDTENKVR